MTHRKSLAAITLATLLVSACAGQQSAPAADPTDIRTNPHFAATDSQLSSRLKLQSLGERREGDLLRFQAVILNNWHADVSFRYQVLWYDAGNMLIGAESRPWHAVSIRPNSVHAIEATAPRASAGHYVIQLQEQ
jgi:uncharacterized protein YcfL